MNHFTEALGLSHFSLYMQDYGGPVGFGMTLAHPERVEKLIVQDAVAHNEGLGACKTRRAFWADRAANESALRTIFFPWRPLARATPAATQSATIRICGRTYYFLNQPGQGDIQVELFYDSHFADVDEYEVDWVLNAYGKYLQDAPMIPVLEKKLENSA